MLGVDRINKWATLFGLGVKTGIDLPNEVQRARAVDGVEATQKMQKKWYAGETISVAIGQGQVSVTPVSMAVYTATLANGGTRVTPHLVKAVDDGNGLKPVPPPPPQSKVDVSPEKLQAIRDGMWMVVNGGGTGGRARIAGHDVCGKTGTAQVISNTGRTAAARSGKDLRDNGWFVFFAPRDNPEIAGVVFLEHGIHGAERRVGRAPHPRRRTSQAGRQAAAAAADARRDAARLQGSVRARRRRRRGGSSRTMFERRLYFHVDWLLLGAILLLAGIGIAMIYSTTYVTLPDAAATPGRRSGRRSTRWASAWSRCSSA